MYVHAIYAIYYKQEMIAIYFQTLKSHTTINQLFIVTPQICFKAYYVIFLYYMVDLFINIFV